MEKKSKNKNQLHNPGGLTQLNQVILSGKLTFKGELSKGGALTIGIVNNSYRNAKEREDQYQMFYVALFGTRAKFINDYAKLGAVVQVVGSLRSQDREYVQDGKTVTRKNVISLIANEVAISYPEEVVEQTNTNKVEEDVPVVSVDEIEKTTPDVLDENDFEDVFGDLPDLEF